MRQIRRPVQNPVRSGNEQVAGTHDQASVAGEMDIYAHRGSTVLAPENTLPAFDLALSHGADVLEIDVRISRDGHVIVIHDARVDRTCNGHGAVAELSLSQLKALDAAFRFRGPEGQSQAGQGIRLMTLDELFERYPQVRINIDIKDDDARASQAVAESIDRADALHRVNVGSFHNRALTRFRQMAPHVSTAASQREVAQLYFLGNLPPRTPVYRYLQIPVSYFGIRLTGRRFIQRAHQLGIELVYWTINDEQSMRALIAAGAHGIVTDRPDVANRLRHATSGS